MFDPTIGRWQTKDPKSFDAGDTNLYRYVGNHPSYATDPSGLEEPVHAKDFQPSKELKETLYWAREYIKTSHHIEEVNSKHANLVRYAMSRLGAQGLARNPKILRGYNEDRDRQLRLLNQDLETFAAKLSGEYGNVEIPDLWKWHDDSVITTFGGGTGAVKAVELAYWLSENGVQLGSGYSMGGGMQDVTLETAMLFTGGGATFIRSTLAGVAARTAAIQATKETLLGPLAPVKGGFASIGGGPSGASFANSSNLLDEVLSVAQSSKFIDRARRLGFSDELIQSLPNRILQYGDRLGEIPTGGWADASQLLIGKRSLLSTRTQRIAHELGHVLDDLSKPGLFQRAGQAGFGFEGFYKAERVAYMMQYGRNPVPLTLFNAGMQSHPYTTTAIVGGFIVGGYLFSDYVFN